jgi:hypothetical protein
MKTRRILSTWFSKCHETALVGECRLVSPDPWPPYDRQIRFSGRGGPCTPAHVTRADGMPSAPADYVCIVGNPEVIHLAALSALNVHYGFEPANTELVSCAEWKSPVFSAGLCGSPAWIRTTIHGSKGRCPTIRRPGTVQEGKLNVSLTRGRYALFSPWRTMFIAMVIRPPTSLRLEGTTSVFPALARLPNC